MAQLRQDYAMFAEREAEILVIGHESLRAFRSYWNQHSLPFTGIPDQKGSILRNYGQEVNIFKLGRMPAQAVIDKHGIIRYIHYGHSMADIPESGEILAILDEINSPEHAQLGEPQGIQG
jgi:peroxiredoxin Q/BCP